MDKQTVRQPMKLIKRSEMVENFTMPEAIICMSEAFESLSSGECYVPKRYVVRSSDEYLTLLLKPAFMNNYNKSSIKVLTQKNSRPVPNIPTIIGIVLLVDNVTGEILSIMDGEYITALRTGAASGLATQLFSKEDSHTLALFGCGTQGRTQLEAVCAVRQLDRIWVFDKSHTHAELFIDEMQETTAARIEFTSDLSVLKGVDIICTATNSASPLFFKKHLREGTHINAIGSFTPEMQELASDIVNSARIYFDDADACMNESGDCIKAFGNSGASQENIVGEIGDYVLNKIEGRTTPDEITIFKSVGTAIQDLVVANRIYDKSITENFGNEVRLYE